jgi:hypothetical protein
MAKQLSTGVPGYLFTLMVALLVIVALASLATVLLSLRLDVTLEELESEDFSDVQDVGAAPGDGDTAIAIEGFACTSKTYVPVMAAVYSGNKHTVTGLAATLSIRNVSETEQFGITRVDYFDRNGKRLRRYVSDPLRLGPLQTRQYYIDLTDSKGSSGANLIVAWAANRDTPDPLVDAVMIGGYGTKGISLTSRSTPPERSCP